MQCSLWQNILILRNVRLINLSPDWISHDRKFDEWKMCNFSRHLLTQIDFVTTARVLRSRVNRGRFYSTPVGGNTRKWQNRTHFRKRLGRLPPSLSKFSQVDPDSPMCAHVSHWPGMNSCQATGAPWAMGYFGAATPPSLASLTYLAHNDDCAVNHYEVSPRTGNFRDLSFRS